MRKIDKIPTTSNVEPDTRAAIEWLTNRRPELWREQREAPVTFSDFNAQINAIVKAIENNQDSTQPERERVATQPRRAKG